MPAGCILWAQRSVSAGYGLPLACAAVLQSMPVSCHFRGCTVPLQQFVCDSVTLMFMCVILPNFKPFAFVSRHKNFGAAGAARPFGMGAWWYTRFSCTWLIVPISVILGQIIRAYLWRSPKFDTPPRVRSFKVTGTDMDWSATCLPISVL